MSWCCCQSSWQRPSGRRSLARRLHDVPRVLRHRLRHLYGQRSDEPMEADRCHPRKRRRPFASGDLPGTMGVVVAPLLLVVGVALGHAIGAAAVDRGICRGLLGVLTQTERIAAGRHLYPGVPLQPRVYTAAAKPVGYGVSPWLLAFSIFLFLGLSTIKRVGEPMDIKRHARQATARRGYQTDDISILQTLGVSASFVSVTVLALFIQSDSVAARYTHPEYLWDGRASAALLAMPALARDGSRPHARRPDRVRCSRSRLMVDRGRSYSCLPSGARLRLRRRVERHSRSDPSSMAMARISDLKEQPAGVIRRVVDQRVAMPIRVLTMRRKRALSTEKSGKPELTERTESTESRESVESNPEHPILVDPTAKLSYHIVPETGLTIEPD